jgi:hypothetical protein
MGDSMTLKRLKVFIFTFLLCAIALYSIGFIFSIDFLSFELNRSSGNTIPHFEGSSLPMILSLPISYLMLRISVINEGK